MTLPAATAFVRCPACFEEATLPFTEQTVSLPRCRKCGWPTRLIRVMRDDLWAYAPRDARGQSGTDAKGA